MQATNEPMRFVVPFDHEILSKARTTKYKRRWRGKDGKWQYEYETPEQEREHKAHLERETWKEIQADMASKITERYDDAHALQRLTEIGSDLYQMQATSQLPSGGYERDDAGLSLMDMRSWNNLGDVYSDRERLKRMRLLLAKYKGQLGANEEGEHFEEYVKLGLWDALRAKQEGDPPRLKPEKNRFGGVNLPLVGDRLKGKSWDNYRDTMRKYKDWGLRFDGTDRAWYVRQADLHTFPWDKMQADLESFGIGMEDLPTFPEPKEAREEEPTPPPPTDVDTTIEAIQRRRINDTVAVTVIKEGEHKGKYAFYSTFSRDFNDIFSNKTGVLTGITEYVRELGHARVTDNRHLVDEALERIRERMPGHTIVIDPKVKATQDAQNEALQAAQKPIPEVTKHLAQGVDLFPFQNAGTRFLIETDGNALIGDEMGLGKTMQTLAYAAAKGRKVLVVCPRVVRKNWLREATRFFPEYFKGRELKSADLRKTGQPDLSGDNIVTVNYESLHKFLPAIEAGGFDTIVIDESHRMKNPKAKITQTLKKLAKPMKHRILLSGTAIKNKKVELYEQLELIKPGMFRSPNELKMATTGGVWHKLKGVYMARAKKDVLKDLPPKISSIVRMDVPLDTLPATPKDIGEISQAKADLAIAKTGATVDFVQELLSSSDSNVLVFSDSKQAANELKRKLGDVAVLHTGDTSEKAREAAISHFDPSTRRPGDPVRVFVATTASAGIGINLQTADKVVFNDLPWTPADLRQAEDRAYRIGTESAVNVYWNTVDGHEFDELIADTIKRKYELSKKVLEGKQLTPAERKWMDEGVSKAEMLARLKGETPPGEPASASEPLESKATQGQPRVEAPPQPEPETTAAHVEGGKAPEPEKVTAAPAAKPKPERPKMVIKAPALPAKAPTPPPQTYAEQKAEGEKLVKLDGTLAERAAEQRDHVSSQVVPQDLRDAMDILHRAESDGKDPRNPFVQRGRADKLEIWFRGNVGRTVEGGKVEAVGSNAWRWRGGGEEITLTRDAKGGAELTYSSEVPEPPPPSKPPETPPAAVPAPEEGAHETVEPKPAPEPEQTAKPAPDAHVGPRKPARATRRQAKLEAAGQLALFKSRRPRFVLQKSGLDGCLERVDRLIKAHDFDEAMDLIKAAGHKYLRRIPIAGGGKRKWRYVYSEASERAAGGEYQAGEKLKLTSGGQAGHYEIEHVFSNGWVTVRHDESGQFMSLPREQLRDMFAVDHADRVRATHERLQTTVAAARKFGTEKQQKRAQDQLLAFRQAWQVFPAAEQPKAVIREFGWIERGDMPAKARELANYDTPTIEGILADVQGRIDASAKSARGTPVELMRWKSIAQSALELRQINQDTATPEEKKAEESTPSIVEPANAAPAEATEAPKVSGVPPEVTKAPPQPQAAKRKPESGKLEAVGDHIYGSIKDLRREGQITSPEQINDLSYRDAARLVKKSNVVPVPDVNTFRGMGMEPDAAHLALATLAAIKQKPADTDEERRAYIYDATRVVESLMNCKTTGDIYELGREINRAQRQAKKWERVQSEPLIPYATRDVSRQDSVLAARLRVHALMKENPGEKYEAHLADDEGNTVSQYSRDATHLVIQRATLLPYESLGARFDRFVRRDGKEFHEVRKMVEAIRMGIEKGHDGWDLLNATGKMADREKQAAAEKKRQKKEGEGKYAKGKTLRGWSEALQVGKVAVREGGTEIPKEANAVRTRQEFNLREIDYGTEGYMSQADREYHTHALEGALHDLSDVLGIPPAMVSFKGRLGIGLGARGKGAAGWKKASQVAAAHYETGKFALNITKFRGGGSLAHEWGHALDNVIIETNVKRQTGAAYGSYATHVPEHSDFPPDVKAAVKGVVDAMMKAPDREAAKAKHKKDLAELEAVRQRELDEWNAMKREYNDLMSKPANEETRLAKIERTKERIEYQRELLARMEGRKGQAADDERKAREYNIESLEAHVKKMSDPKVIRTSEENLRLSDLQSEMHFKGSSIDGYHTPLVELMRKQDPESSNYAKDAAVLGQGYFGMPTEMLARAFASYVEDKLHAQGRKNTYLATGTRVRYLTDLSLRPEEPHAQPFPQGVEREQIHKAVEALIGVMKKGGHLEKSLRSEPNARFVLRK